MIFKRTCECGRIFFTMVLATFRCAKCILAEVDKEVRKALLRDDSNG